MNEIGQKPVLLSREIQGFALNRIQFAILTECWRLIAEDVLSVKDVDSVMKDGLGMRYAFLGPMETAHLNAEGDFANFSPLNLYRFVCKTFKDSVHSVNVT